MIPNFVDSLSKKQSAFNIVYYGIFVVTFVPTLMLTSFTHAIVAYVLSRIVNNISDALHALRHKYEAENILNDKQATQFLISYEETLKHVDSLLLVVTGNAMYFLLHTESVIFPVTKHCFNDEFGVYMNVNVVCICLNACFSFFASITGIWSGGLVAVVKITASLSFFYQELGVFPLPRLTSRSPFEMALYSGYMFSWFGACTRLNHEIHAVEELFQENEDPVVKELRLYQAQCASGHSCGVQIFSTATLSRTFVFSVSDFCSVSLLD